MFTCYHPKGLKQQKFILTQIWRPKSKIKVWVGLCPPPELEGASSQDLQLSRLLAAVSLPLCSRWHFLYVSAPHVPIRDHTCDTT